MDLIAELNVKCTLYIITNLQESFPIIIVQLKRCWILTSDVADINPSISTASCEVIIIIVFISELQKNVLPSHHLYCWQHAYWWHRRSIRTSRWYGDGGTEIDQIENLDGDAVNLAVTDKQEKSLLDTLSLSLTHSCTIH